VLHRRGLTYGALARKLKVSESTVKRMFSRGAISVARLEDMCRLFDIDVFDLARESRLRELRAEVLSEAQETALAADPVLLAVFHLLLNDWEAERIRASYSIEAPQMVLLLSTLERLGLIELKPGNLVKLRISPRMSWSRQRQVRSRYEKIVREEFLDSRFDRSGEILRFEVRELTQASIEILQEKIGKLAAEIQELADRDAASPSESRRSVGCLLTARPWVFSVLTSLERHGVLANPGPTKV
jgi:transcriptional regulator with XRE-family HTH domain